jgi:hypothetical protein
MGRLSACEIYLKIISTFFIMLSRGVTFHII